MTTTNISSETEGQEYLIPYLDRPWDPEDITVQDIKKYADDFFIQNMFMKLTNFIFLGPPVYNVMQNGKQREDIAEPMREMLKKTGFIPFLKMVWYDVCIWGNSLYSEGIDQDQKNLILLNEFRSLPPELFAYPGGAMVVPYMYGNYVMNPNYTYGRLLKGIERHDDETVHYWQRMKYQIAEVKNCRLIKSPIRSYFIDGVPLFLPLYKLLPKIYFALDQLMMHNNRSNMLFLTVEGKNPLLPDNKTSAWSYSQTVLKSASNKNSFALPASVTPTEFKQPSSDIHLKTIDLLTKWLISYITPADIISKGDGSLIGGSSNYEAQLFKMFSESFQEFIAHEAENILDEWLAWNGRGDCHVEVTMKKLSFDNEELDFNIGQSILDQVNKGKVIGDINEVRAKFRLENADDKFLQKSKAEWEAVSIAAVQQGTSDSATPEYLDTEAIKKDTAFTTEDDVKEDIKQNQGIMPDRAQIQANCERELIEAWSKFFQEVGV